MIEKEQLRNEGSAFILKVGVSIWTLAIILFGTSFRTRSLEQQYQAPTVDWLIISQVLICLLGGFVGILFLRKSSRWGLGSKSILIYILVTGLSIFGASEKTTVFGYWILLTGICLLTLGIVKKAQSFESLLKIEKAWLIIITLLIFKDSILSFLYFEVSSSGDPFRIGSNVTHPVTLSIMTLIAFFISFRKNLKYPNIWWLIRIFFIAIIVLTRTRVSLIGLFIGGIVGVWYLAGIEPKKGTYLRIFLPCSFLAAIILFLLTLSMDISVTKMCLQFFNRGHDISNMTSLSDRTTIWPVAINRVFDNSITFLFGHGYGISRLVLMNDLNPIDYNAAHAHNTFLEFLLNMGLLGGVTCLLLYSSGLKWFFDFNNLRRIFSNDFAVRAIIVIAVIFMSSFSESLFARKIDPVQVIFFYYIIALDQAKTLSNTITTK